MDQDTHTQTKGDEERERKQTKNNENKNNRWPECRLGNTKNKKESPSAPPRNAMFFKGKGRDREQ